MREGLCLFDTQHAVKQEHALVAPRVEIPFLGGLDATAVLKKKKRIKKKVVTARRVGPQRGTQNGKKVKAVCWILKRTMETNLEVICQRSHTHHCLLHHVPEAGRLRYALHDGEC